VLYCEKYRPQFHFAKGKAIFCRGRKAKVRLVDNRIRLHMLVDRRCIEIFANEGRV
jgi:sucrose-6-phosphate hydrolase SacC (GH32 family)